LWKASGENVVNEDELSQFSRSVNDLIFLSSAAALCIGSFLQVLEFGLNIVIGFFGLKLSIVGFVIPVIVLVFIANLFHFQNLHWKSLLEQHTAMSQIELDNLKKIHAARENQYADRENENYAKIQSLIENVSLLKFGLKISHNWHALLSTDVDTRETALKSLTHADLSTKTALVCAAADSFTRANIEREQRQVISKKVNEALKVERLCNICYQNPKSIVFFPCRHICCCSECAAKVHIPNTDSKCILCNTTITSSFSVYL
jgi:hypothetical protein